MPSVMDLDRRLKDVERQLANGAPALPELIPFSEICKKYGLSIRSLADVAKGYEHVRLGTRRYFTLEQLGVFLAGQTVAPVKPAAEDAKDKMRQRRDRRAARR